MSLEQEDKSIKKTNFFPPIDSLISNFSLNFSNINLNLPNGIIEVKNHKNLAPGIFNKVKFTPEEDLKLIQIMTNNCCKNWKEVASMMQTRNPRQCRERWNNYLNPYIRNDPWNPQEDALLIKKYKEYGSKWRKISKFFVNRSDNALRNRYNLLMRHYNKYQNSSSPHESSSD